MQLGSDEFWPGQRFSVNVHCDLDLRDMTLRKGHDTPLGHEQQLCEILSSPNLAVRSYCPDTHLQCDLDRGDITLDQVHDTLWHMENNSKILSRSGKWVRSYCPDKM